MGEEGSNTRMNAEELDPDGDDPDLTIRKIARLARLELPEERLARLSPQLGRILEQFQVLAELPVDELEPMAHPELDRDGLRPDESRESLPSRTCLLYTSPSPRDLSTSRMPSSA